MHRINSAPPQVNIAYSLPKQRNWRPGWVVYTEKNVLPSTVRTPSNNPLHHLLSIYTISFPEHTCIQLPQQRYFYTTRQINYFIYLKMLQEVLHNTKPTENRTFTIRGGGKGNVLKGYASTLNRIVFSVLEFNSWLKLIVSSISFFVMRYRILPLCKV